LQKVNSAQVTSDTKKKVPVTGLLDTIFGSGNCNCKKKYEKKVRDYEYDLNKTKQNVKMFSDKAIQAKKELDESQKKYSAIVTKNTELEKINK
jgi:hypothetical protein